LEEIGLDKQRLQMINISAAMGSKFALSATDFTEEVRQLGPNPIKKHRVEKAIKP
jgi:coenzyme F420-reducing hydrogenase delta subunit